MEVRDGPGSSSNPLGYLRKGTKVRVAEECWVCPPGDSLAGPVRKTHKRQSVNNQRFRNLYYVSDLFWISWLKFACGLVSVRSRLAADASVSAGRLLLRGGR